MERVEIRYDKKKLYRAIGLIGIPLVVLTVMIFFTDILFSNQQLAKLRIIFQTVVVLADVYLIYTLFKKSEMFSDLPTLIVTSNTIEIKEDGQWTIFHSTDNVKVNVIKERRGKTEVDILVVSDKNKTKEVNIYPLDKNVNELKSLMVRFS